MKAIVVDPPGKTADSLRLADVPDPQPSDEEVLLRVHASALNRADMMQRMGNYPAQHGASEILGLELAGEVVEVGSQVRGLSVGDRVYGLSGGGGYAELATLHQSLAMPIPDELTYHEAASIPEVFFTANTAVRTLGETLPGERILVQGVGQNGAYRIRARQHDPDRPHLTEFVHEFRGQPRVGRNPLTGLRNRHGDRQPETAKGLEMEIQRLPALPGQLPDVTPADPLSAFDDDFAVRLDVPLDALVEEHVLQRFGQRQADTVAGERRVVRVKETRQDRFRLPEPQRPQEDRRRKALLAVDADLQEPPRVRLELEP